MEPGELWIGSAVRRERNRERERERRGTAIDGDKRGIKIEDRQMWTSGGVLEVEIEALELSHRVEHVPAVVVAARLRFAILLLL